MKRVFGIETEYGITIQGSASVDVVAESIELVRSYTEHGAHMKWDYRLEDPHRDARGFRAAELLQDTDESAYYEIDRSRPLSFEEIKSDLVLSQWRALLQRPRASRNIRRRNARRCASSWRTKKPASEFWPSARGAET